MTIIGISKLENERLVLDVTERRGRVVNTTAIYSGGPGLKSRSEDRLS
jgi:hypothetical protein